MNKDGIHAMWVAHPTGAIGKGEFCPACKRFNVRNTTVQMLAIDGDIILLLKRNLNPEKGSWALPAGYLGWDETVEEGMAREMREEMGMEIKELKFFRVYSDPKRDRDGRQNIALVFVGEVEGELKPDLQEVAEFGWFAMENLPEPMAFDHRKIIEDYFRTSSK